MFSSYYNKDINLTEQNKRDLIKLYHEYRGARGWDKSKITLPSHLDDSPIELEHILYTLSSQKTEKVKIPEWITDLVENGNQSEEFPIAKTFREKMNNFTLYYEQSEFTDMIEPLLKRLDNGYDVRSNEVEKRVQELRSTAIEWALAHSDPWQCYITATQFPDITLEEKIVFKDKLYLQDSKWEQKYGDEIESLDREIAELKNIEKENRKLKDAELGGIVDKMCERAGVERRFFNRLGNDESSTYEKIFRWAYNDPSNPATIELTEGGNLDIYTMGGNGDSDFNGDLYEYLNANILLEGEDEEIVKLLLPKKNALIEKVLSRQGGNSYKFNEIESIQVETLGYYNDLAITVKSKRGSEMGIVFGYGDVADTIGRVATEKIRKILDGQKEEIKTKNENGYYKKRPFNKIDEVWFKGSEAGGGDNIQLKDLDKLQDHIRKMYTGRSVPKKNEGYDKTWIEVKLSNVDGEDFTIRPRIDIAETEGNFDPQTSTVKRYLQKLYNKDTITKTVNGLELYIDLRDRIDFIKANEIIDEIEADLKEDPNYMDKTEVERESLVRNEMYEIRDSGVQNSEFCSELLNGDYYTIEEMKEEAGKILVAKARFKNEAKRNESKSNNPDTPKQTK